MPIFCQGRNSPQPGGRFSVSFPLGLLLVLIPTCWVLTRMWCCAEWRGTVAQHFTKRAALLTRDKREQRARVLPRGSLKGTHPGVPPNGGPCRYRFSKLTKKSHRVLGLTTVVFPPCLVVPWQQRNTKLHGCRFAGGLLGGPGSVLLSSWLWAGKIAWQNKI